MRDYHGNLGDDNNMWKSIVQWIALPMCGFCFGFGSSEFLAVQDVRKQIAITEGTTSKSIAVFEQRLNRQDETMKEMRDTDDHNRQEFATRMSGMAGLVEKSIENANRILEVDKEIVGLFRLQQQVKTP